MFANRQTRLRHRVRVRAVGQFAARRCRVAGRNKKVTPSDRGTVFEFTPECLSDHRLAR